MKKKPVRPEPSPAAVPPPAPPPAPRGPLVYLAASIAILAPCFWLSRLQAGDLSSHIYNSWLAELIGRGQAPGLSLATQTTNVLFDWILSALFRTVGAAAAQRIAVSLAVLIFVWGAFAFVSVVSRRRAWHMLPWIALLAYGWVFHMGFFGFYLSLGLCFWALAFSWNLEPLNLARSAPVLLLAYVAHALPVLWAAGILAYLWLARRVGQENERKLLVGSLCAVVVLKLAIGSAMPTRWALSQITLFTGADQFLVFDGKYMAAAAGALLMWAMLLMRLKGTGRGPLFQICVLTAVGIVLIPTAILIPGYKHSLVYVAERMSLALAICLCGLVAAAPSRPIDRYATATVAALFFGMLFRDELLLNRFEDQIEAAVAQLPPSQRVISGIEQSSLRVNALAHMIDRVCIGRCYSYANYEPSTAQFRVRVNAANPIVAAEYGDSSGMQTGKYEVKERDLPLYQLLVDDRGQIQIRVPPVGQACGVSAWDVL